MPPIITFVSDFGLDGAAGICRAVMLSIAPDAQVVDISHVVRKYAVRDGAYVLWSAVPWLPIGVHLAIVDPGVGTERRPIAIRTARGDVLVGPDNGLLRPAAERLGGIVEARVIENRRWLLPATSRTFHGRDVFAPAAAHLAAGQPFEDAGSIVATGSLVELEFPAPRVGPGVLETSVIYVDSFGNLRLAGGAAELERALGSAPPGTALEVELDATGGPRLERLRWSRTFGDLGPGDLLAYEDSSGNLAIAVSNGDAARQLGVASGARISIRAG